MVECRPAVLADKTWLSKDIGTKQRKAVRTPRPICENDTMLFPQLLDTSCFCADPCTQSVQDLNWLLCFHNFSTAAPHKGGGGPSQPRQTTSHGRGQAAGSSRVTGSLYPQQTQEGTRDHRGGYGGLGTHARTPPHGSTRPLCFGVHKSGSSGVVQRWGTVGDAKSPKRCRHPEPVAQKGQQRGNLSPWRGSSGTRERGCWQRLKSAC